VTDFATIADTIWVTDAELIRRSGVPEKIMRANLRALDGNPQSGFPKKDKLWGDRRHWPSVLDYWKRQAEPKMTVPPMRRVS
jgi:hypothetical protein